MMVYLCFKRYRSKGKVGHVVEGVPLSRVKDRLSLVRGALVECPLVSSSPTQFYFSKPKLKKKTPPPIQDFLIEDKDLVSGPEWTVLNPTLPIYI